MNTYNNKSIHNRIQDVVRVAFDEDQELPRTMLVLAGIVIGLYLTVHLMSLKSN